MAPADSTRRGPRRLTYKPRELRSGIERKLRLAFRAGSERNAWIQLDGRDVLRVTMPKVHKGDVPIGTLSEIRKQLALTREQFDRLIACPMSATDYENLIRVKQRTGSLPPPRGY